MIKPIKEGSKLGIIAPAFPPDAEKLRKGIDYLLSKGFEADTAESLTAKHGYFAGSDDLRLKDLYRMYADPTIDAIICARGGWGTLRLLDKLDYNLIRNNPKLLIGYSDITTLQLAIWAKTGVPSLSGPMVAVEMGSGILDFTEKHFWQIVNNRGDDYSFDINSKEIEIWRNGKARGLLLGGCLSMVVHQLGTPYSPDYRGAVLFLEEIGEEPYKIDRYLAQLKQAGVLDNINGLILGNFIDCDNDDSKRDSFTCKEVLQDYFAASSYPVIYNFPYGHGMYKFSMPIGVQAVLDTKKQHLQMDSFFI